MAVMMSYNVTTCKLGLNSEFKVVISQLSVKVINSCNGLLDQNMI